MVIVSMNVLTIAYVWTENKSPADTDNVRAQLSFVLLNFSLEHSAFRTHSHMNYHDYELL